MCVLSQSQFKTIEYDGRKFYFILKATTHWVKHSFKLTSFYTGAVIQKIYLFYINFTEAISLSWYRWVVSTKITNSSVTYRSIHHQSIHQLMVTLSIKFINQFIYSALKIFLCTYNFFRIVGRSLSIDKS